MATIAAGLLALLFVAQQDSEPTLAQQASGDVHALCVALIAWGLDHPPDGPDFGERRDASVNFELATRIAPAEAESMLVPYYFDRMPGPDPWGRPYQMFRNADPAQGWSWAARSVGPDGKFWIVVYPHIRHHEFINKILTCRVAGFRHCYHLPEWRKRHTKLADDPSIGERVVNHGRVAVVAG